MGLVHVSELMNRTEADVIKRELERAEIFAAKPRPIRITHIFDERQLINDNRKTYYEALVRAYGAKCAYCGKRKRLDIDHIHPVSKGGYTCFQNLQLLCRTCNLKKGDKLPHEIGHILW